MSDIIGSILGATHSAVSGVQHAVSSVAGAVAPSPSPQSASKGPGDQLGASGTPLNVMSFNYARGRNASVDTVAKYVQSKNTDVLAVQEINPSQAKEMAQKLHMNYKFQGDPTGTGAFMNGKAIFSKYPIKQSDNTVFSTDPISAVGKDLVGQGPKGEGLLGALGRGAASMVNRIQDFFHPGEDAVSGHQTALNPPALELRGAQEATIDVNGQAVHMFNTHLSNANPVERESQAQELKTFVDGYGGPKVVMGDFNANPAGSPQVKNLASEFNNGLGAGDNVGIDHVYTSKDLDLLDSYVDDTTPPMSDHQPVIGQLLL